MWHWQEAIKAVFAGKVTVVDVYPGVMIRAASIEIPLPSVIALNDYVHQPNSVRDSTESQLFLINIYFHLSHTCKNRNQPLPNGMYSFETNTGASIAIIDITPETFLWIMFTLEAWVVH